MEKLIAKQESAFDNLKKLVRNYKKEAKARKSKIYISTRLEALTEYWLEFRKTHREIVTHKESGKELSQQATRYFEEDMYDEAQECFLLGKSEMQEEIQILHPEPSATTTEKPDEKIVHNDHEEVKLPRVNLPKFSGSYNEWPSFRDLFVTLIHANNRISNVQKLHYLKSTLSGDAEQLLRHFTITESNYMPAWKALNDRYNNKRLLIKAQLKLLLSQPACTNDSASSIRRILDTTNECLQALRNLNIDVDKWDMIIAYIVSERLPHDTKRLWEQNIGSNLEFPTYDELRQFLEGQFRALEALGSDSRRFIAIPRQTSISRQTNHVTREIKCALCSGNHSIRLCEQFLKLDFENKRNVVQKKGLCSNCLSPGHKAMSCPSIHNCLRCKHRHHTLLHSDTAIANLAVNRGKVPMSSEVVKNPIKISPVEEGANSFYVQDPTTQREVLLATALVRICAPSGQEVTARALLDQGSQVSLISEHIVQLLKLRKSTTTVNISGVGNSKAGISKASVQFTLKSRHGGAVLKTSALVLKSITSVLPTRSVKLSKDFINLKDLCMADPQCFEPNKIQILLGADVYGRILLDGIRRSENGNLVAQNTTLGWILSGEVPAPQTRTLVSCHSHVDLDHSIRRFWELEETRAERHLTEEEMKCEQFYKDTVRRSSDGRYIVKLPFVNGQRPHFGASRNTALRRFNLLEARFERSPQLRDEYSACIQEYRQLCHMLPVSTPKIESNDKQDNKNYFELYYLPHHAVFKESTTTKLRVVFDASQKSTYGPSLNDVLMVGPKLQDDLLHILLRWRRHKIVFTADLEKMYRQIKVSEDDVDFQRVLWRPSPTESIQDFCLHTVTFGTACAPYLAIKTLHQLADDESRDFPRASAIVKSDFYVDDLLTGANTIEEATQLQEQLIRLLHLGGFNLRKWTTNNPELIKAIPLADQELSNIRNFEFDDGIKTLGVLWCPKADAFMYKLNTYFANSESITKRDLLSQISKLFDPLGLLSPIMIRAKILMQSVWLSGMDWDDKLSQDFLQAWNDFRKDLRNIESIKIPRWLHTTTDEIELHGFCDASNRAYAAVFYVRSVDVSGNIYTHLLTSKTKVAPIKPVTLARLELCGAILLVRLFKIIKKALRINKIRLTLWCDSTITLAWIRAHPSRWKTFVANRVAEIQETVDCSSWKYVSSKDNPADCASRGLAPTELISHTLWWRGPSWLEKPEVNWPNPIQIDKTNLEERAAVKVYLAVALKEGDAKLVTTHSKLTRLLRVSAYCFRFIKNCKTLSKCPSIWLTTTELNQALTYWIKDAQQDEFMEELSTLKSGREITNGKLGSLTPFLDDEGVLRVGGRLHHADLPWFEKHPIILSSNHPLTRLIILDYHERTLHGGPQLMMGLIRKRYWILKLRSSIKGVLHRCMKCFRQKAKPEIQLMGNLPSPRTRMTRPFTHVGVDFCGPFNLKVSRGRGQKTYKGYLAIFVCLAVRAIHIEVVSDLTSEAFHAALKRFISRRGLCSHIYSDNGTNFVGTNKLINKDFEQHLKQLNVEMPQIITDLKMEWHFIPPSAPNFGGLWEAGVKSTKYHLKRIINDLILTYEEMATVATQIEACLNSRPITPITDDPEDLSALTPGHFLIGEAPLALPEPSVLDTRTTALTRWHHLTHLVQSFWKRWHSEYLSRLQQRPKWLQKRKNLEVGQLVLIKEERLPPTKWMLGRIIDTHPGTDQLVRVVTLKTKDKILKRPTSKVCLLPFEELTQNEGMHNTNTTNLT